MTVLARVGALWVFPVKSMSGARVEQAGISSGGVAGDRSWAVLDEQGATLTAKQEPRLREAVARLEAGELRVDVPGAPPALDERAAAEALSAWLGRPVHLERRGDAGFADVAPVHLVSDASLADAAHAEQCDACDVAAPRANLVLELAPGHAGERDWVGRQVQVGSARLALSRTPKHCLGVYADVVAEGIVAVGDELRAQ